MKLNIDGLSASELLDSLTPDELRELAEEKDKTEKWRAMTNGLRELAGLMDRHPELPWPTNWTVSLWAPWSDDLDTKFAWIEETAAQLGGEWERQDDDSFINMRRLDPNAVTIELTFAKPDAPKAVEDARPDGADVTGAVEGGDV